jgi:hypothetical protein
MDATKQCLMLLRCSRCVKPKICFALYLIINIHHIEKCFINVIELKSDEMKHADGLTDRHSHPIMRSYRAYCTKIHKT